MSPDSTPRAGMNIPKRIREYIKTDRADLQEVVDRVNHLFTEWEDFIRLNHNRILREVLPESRLTLYMDQETMHQILMLMDSCYGCGPFQFDSHREPVEYRLFSIPVDVIEVCYRGDFHTHLLFIPPEKI